MWNDQRIAVVLPTYNERASIAQVIEGFQALGIVDDIIVVNNNAAPGTSVEVASTGAREVFESTQGYGAAIRRGLREAKAKDADLICICEPDGTFEPRDLGKLLPFTVECEVVFGSRTVSTYIWRGANMGWFLRWGNWAVAKMIEVLYNTVYLSDVGCTMRVISGETAAAIEKCYVGEGSSFGLEQLVLVVSSGASFVQVPVNYRPRVGESAVTGDFAKAFKLGLEMIGIALSYRFRRASIRRQIGPLPEPR
jgi:glycosyltransferase involved in cell wall biosynthesis